MSTFDGSPIEKSKINYEKLTMIIDDFLKTKSLKIDDISKIYINIGPGSFAGIRNSLSVVKAFNIAKKIDYYCYSFEDFKDIKDELENKDLIVKEDNNLYLIKYSIFTFTFTIEVKSE